MNANFKYLLAAGTLGLTLSFAHAADNTAMPSGQGTLTSEQARDLKTESKAEYKARKKVAEAQEDLDVADCKTSNLDSKNERDCKHDAKQISKESKKEAKQMYKDEKADIKSLKE
ncbi:hypothetical protein [Aquabacterium sp.]|uniref:hypothetical protein n=1 Tax=Aquabacterium sp. TaxID=1872578 RepID=UPI003D6D58B6